MGVVKEITEIKIIDLRKEIHITTNVTIDEPWISNLMQRLRKDHSANLKYDIYFFRVSTADRL